MKVISAVVLVGILVCYTNAQDLTLNTTCDHKLPLFSLDANKFANNTWYEVKRYKNRLTPEAGCVRVDHTTDEPTKTLKSVVFTFWHNKTEHNASFNLQTVDGKNNKYFVFDKTTKVDDVPYEIIYTDYENVAIIFGCIDNTTSTSIQRLSILSRNRNLTEYFRGVVDSHLQMANIAYTENVWDTLAETDENKCSSASTAGVSTLLSILAMLLLVWKN